MISTAVPAAGRRSSGAASDSPWVAGRAAEHAAPTHPGPPRPDPGGAEDAQAQADWHLVLGDAGSLAAVGAALERIPPGRQAIAVLEMSDLTGRHRVTSPGALTVHWLYPGGALLGTGRALVSTVRALDFPAGQVHAVVLGDGEWVREARRHLLVERGIGRGWVATSGSRTLAPAGERR